MDFEIRESKQEDYDVLCRLFKQGDFLHHQALPDIFSKPSSPVRSKEFIFSLLEDEAGAIFVAEVKEQVIGFISLKVITASEIPILEAREYVEISSLVVDKKYRCQGVGAALMKSAHDWAREKEINEVELNVYKFNQEAISFYKKMGYNVRSQKMTKSLNEAGEYSS